MTNDVGAARALLAERGFRVPEVDLPDVCKAAHGLAQTVAHEARSLGIMDVDVDFAQTLIDLAPPALPLESALQDAGAVGGAGDDAVARLSAALRCIDASELGKLAWREIDRAEALTCARSLDAGHANGLTRGLLQGIPVGIKDMFDRQGHVAGWGSRMRAHEAPATQDATIVTRLRAAGAVIVGVQHMAEFAMSPTGLNATYGPGRNPWNIDHVCGGSSSGGGMTVGAGHVPLAIGSDTGGSVRLPAAFCGVPGMKPTQYRVSLAGAMPLSPNLDTLGPLAESVALCGRALMALSGPDARDHACLDVDLLCVDDRNPGIPDRCRAPTVRRAIAFGRHAARLQRFSAGSSRRGRALRGRGFARPRPAGPNGFGHAGGRIRSRPPGVAADSRRRIRASGSPTTFARLAPGRNGLLRCASTARPHAAALYGAHAGRRGCVVAADDT